MDLYLLRHGRAEKIAQGGGSDAGRSLTERGRTEIREVARWIRSQGYRIDLIATSPLARARQTARIIADEYPGAGSPAVWEELAPGAGFSTLLSRLLELPADTCLLLVGHEPSMSGCIAGIISESGEARILLKKGGLAKIVNFSPSTQESGELSWLLTPRHMRTRRQEL